MNSYRQNENISAISLTCQLLAKPLGRTPEGGWWGKMPTVCACRRIKCSQDVHLLRQLDTVILVCLPIGYQALWEPHILIDQLKCRANTIQDDERSGRGNGP